ncbi:hypothetical protein LX32DRAFT_287156 [Colletotrichum zoysiae]|uniref:Uncharacterized protein n=1 Tax=Colletotrichum zoysiae TaxID=1216348 RepID=A0AAD9H3I6_9PEZI|nr:hypothetical protein LX32DRAFT_287156 [Colletotrichum zoysiae]
MTGWETLTTREKKLERERLSKQAAKRDMTEAEHEERRKKQKVYNDNHKDRMQKDSGFRDRVNSDRRKKRQAKKEILNNWQGGALSGGSGGTVQARELFLNIWLSMF